MITFMIGLFAGGFAGVVLFAILAMSHDSDLQMRITELKEQLRKEMHKYQALVLADDFYFEMSHRKNRIHQLQFEMRYIENDFTERWSADERKEIAKTCEEMFEEERRDYIANLDDVSERGDDKTFTPATGPMITLGEVIAEAPDYSREATRAL